LRSFDRFLAAVFASEVPLWRVFLGVGLRIAWGQKRGGDDFLAREKFGFEKLFDLPKTTRCCAMSGVRPNKLW